MAVDRLASVDADAQLAPDVEVGPFAVIGPGVEIGSGTKVGSHTVISGRTRIGRDNRIAPFVSLGDAPQHRGYQGEATTLEIGDRNTIREYVSVHRGTAADRGDTTIGDDNFVMAYAHIAHDCVLGNNINMANGASLAGHVRVDSGAVLSGFALVYQYRCVGKLAFLAYSSGVVQDVPAFTRAAGSPAYSNGINSIGMRRSGYSSDDIRALKAAYRVVYRQQLKFDEARAKVREAAVECDAVAEFADTLERSTRGIVR
ncbi:acyl-ACP--UDP-N-acetylglucosamine O-acyltransferase [Salinisphaera sp. USBA-960]|uniref:acyl-ACP--UDP-N-acetylglucosamine O-acyltransferase n=1 Tax=Salinisphaera orenii TaxID=856731 RepID=UPI000DBE6C82|nr:acyl-ACP--UDP-N-acetylglucosamine O-acyltransferase [Salifodinibacter halophilus]NNC26207.1 acyl-ACP--UDP-N-acetylglucosamine O-acyltransferase [Salifodinibacter halophilus]